LKDWPDPIQELRLKQLSIPEWDRADVGMKRKGSTSFTTRSLYEVVWLFWTGPIVNV
jgi:hypothetical protein